VTILRTEHLAVPALQISAAGLPEFRSEVPLKPYSIPLGKAHVAREGKDVTVVAYGAAAVSAAKNEADSLEKEQGVSVEVINLRTVHPWDLETIKTSVKKTGRCIIFHEDYAKKSAGQILKGELEEDLGFLEYIKTPTIKVLGADYMFVPTDTELAWARLPYERIGKGVNIRHRSAKLRHLIEDAVTWN